MRLLIVSPVYPFPPRDGSRILVAEPLHYLTELGHTVTLLCEGSPDVRHQPAVRGLHVHTVPASTRRDTRLRVLARSWFTGVPDAVLRACSPALQHAVAMHLHSGEYDLLHLEHQATAPLGRIARSLSIPAVLRQHNVEHDLYAGLAQLALRSRNLSRWAHFELQARLVRRCATELSTHVDLCLALSQADATTLSLLDPELRIEILPAGAATDQIVPAHSSEERAGLVVFPANMGYAANSDAASWFCREVWPLVRRQHLTAQLALVGKNPPPGVRDLAALPGVTVTGEVPSMEPWLRAAQVVIAPLRIGAGVRIKLLEALALGKAIVATPVAASGLELEDRRELRLAGDTPAFAGAVNDLLSDVDQRTHLSAQARARAEQSYSWPQIVQRQSELYLSLLEHRQR